MGEVSPDLSNCSSLFSRVWAAARQLFFCASRGLVFLCTKLSCTRRCLLAGDAQKLIIDRFRQKRVESARNEFFPCLLSHRYTSHLILQQILFSSLVLLHGAEKEVKNPIPKVSTKHFYQRLVRRPSTHTYRRYAYRTRYPHHLNVEVSSKLFTRMDQILSRD